MIDENTFKVLVALFAGVVGAFEFGKRWAERLEKKEEHDAQERADDLQRRERDSADLGKFRGQLLKRIADMEDESQDLRNELRAARTEIAQGQRAYMELERACNLLRMQNDALTSRVQFLEARVQIAEEKQQ
jgi:chromosome segregation ATPase